MKSKFLALERKNKEYDINKGNRVDKSLAYINKRIDFLKKGKLYSLFKENKNIRVLNEKELTTRNVISVFDSVLTRTLELLVNELSDDLIVVQTFFFDVLNDLIRDGFIHRNELYICLTASAGQIRTKKTVFIKKSLFMENQNSLMCGLTIDRINQREGININKYLAYLALCNSATDIWEGFNIDKTIVVEDLETSVSCLVDYIDENTYEITRQPMDVPITHTDGCGMMLPRVSKKNKMLRMPWVKGLLTPVPFDTFIRTHNNKPENKKSNRYFGLVKDIYGKTWDILKDDIEVILVRSQFKTWKYYDSWEEYTNFYKEYKCQAGYCNEEPDNLIDAKINYQMLQTLSDLSDFELQAISQKTKNKIVNIGSDKDTMLKVIGVKDSNKEKNYMQQALEIYPELLNDTYNKELLKDIKKSLVKEARGGKVDIEGKYIFIIPDMYAFCEFLFLKDENPKGLLQNGEVFCKVYKDEPKLDCLRSPHLYLEHAVRNNVVDKEKSKWLISKGLYTSVHDPISKILMFDVDGDKSLCVADKTIIEAAERNMKDIVPLFYNMAKAKPQEVNNENIYKGLIDAYTGGNIGTISNTITKIWNSDDISLEVIKLLCLENNFVIDYAKTLYKPKRPKSKKKLFKKHVESQKVPHFFIYEKDKKEHEVNRKNKSTVNRLSDVIPNPRIKFNATNLGEFDYKKLMSGSANMDQAIIDKYTELDLHKHFLINSNDESNNFTHVYRNIKKQLLDINDNLDEVVNTLVEYLYIIKKSSYKTTLWECFGDILVDNLKNNVEMKLEDGYIQCDNCGERVEKTSNRKKYCDECLAKIREKQNKDKALRYYHNNKNK